MNKAERLERFGFRLCSARIMINTCWAAYGPVFPEEVFLTMRKDIFLPVLALAGGAVGFLLRLWQYASAYDPSTELFAHGAPASLA